MTTEEKLEPDLSSDLVTHLPGLNTKYPQLGKVKTTQFAGCVTVDTKNEGKMFYWFLDAISPDKKNSTSTPIVIFLNGGPGASSLNGLFYENGPYRLNTEVKGYDITENSETWNNKYHLLYVDNPVGTGYSSVNKNGYSTTLDSVAENFMKFLNEFFKLHSNLIYNPLYLTGESFASKYIVYIANYVLKYNNSIKLCGVAIGNGLFLPHLQFDSMVTYANSLGIIDSNERNLYKSQLEYFFKTVKTLNKHHASVGVADVTDKIYKSNNIWDLDVRKTLTDVSKHSNPLIKYCNQDVVKKCLHTQKYTFIDINEPRFIADPFKNKVYKYLFDEFVEDNEMLNLVSNILVREIGILVYNGQFDGSFCCHSGNEAFLNKLNYKGCWEQAPRHKVKNPNTKAVIGFVKKFKEDNLLQYFVMLDSGHMVPHDQPGNSRFMIETFIDNKEWN